MGIGRSSGRIGPLGQVAETLPANAVVGVIAGGGTLPDALHAHLVQRGIEVRSLALNGEATGVRAGETKSIADVEGILAWLETHRITHATMVGWVRRRPTWREGRVGLRALRALPGLLRGLSAGDDGMLRAVVRTLESRGVRVVGVDELWPELLAEAGPLTRARPATQHSESIKVGFEASHRLGELDAGQAVVVVGRRIVALEALEGTDEMLARVADLRKSGRLRGKGGVLVKAVKPSQERRTDLPTIGPSTVSNAVAAKLDGIAVQAGATLLVERERTLADADAVGLFIYGQAAPCRR